jgi:transposase
LASSKKKADQSGCVLILWDESGFSFVPNRVSTWAPIGQTPILRETPGRHNHTGIGYITRTPRRHLLDFRFTIFKGAASFEDFVFNLTDIQHYYRNKVIIVWDNLSGHYSAERYFEEEHPDWFEFEYFPSHSPELNPVEPCWHQIKHVYLPNFVPTSDEELVREVYEAAMRINAEKKLSGCFKQAGLPP